MISIYQKARQGIPLEDILIIDCHCHMGFWKAFHAPRNTAEDMIDSMNSLGVDKAFITAHSSIGPNYVYGNDMVISAVRKYPDKFIGYVTLNPSYKDDMENEIRRCFNTEGIKGIKLHPGSHGAAVDYKNYRIAYETANDKCCPILIHVWGKGDVAAIDKLSSKYPKAQFIMGHSGGADIKAMEDAVKVAASHENVYLDLAISMVYEGNVEWFVNEVGSKKVLYASDMPFFDPRPNFGRVAMAELADDEKQNIFGLNMERILSLVI